VAEASSWRLEAKFDFSFSLGERILPPFPLLFLFSTSRAPSLPSLGCVPQDTENDPKKREGLEVEGGELAVLEQYPDGLRIRESLFENASVDSSIGVCIQSVSFRTGLQSVQREHQRKKQDRIGYVASLQQKKYYQPQRPTTTQSSSFGRTHPTAFPLYRNEYKRVSSTPSSFSLPLPALPSLPILPPTTPRKDSSKRTVVKS